MNLEILGQEMSLTDLVERNCAFKAKLMIFTTHKRDNINESTFQLEFVDVLICFKTALVVRVQVTFSLTISYDQK